MPDFEDRLKQVGLEGLNEFSIDEFALIVGHSRIWVHRAILKGERYAVKKEIPVDEEFSALKWRISIHIARAWYNEVKEDLESKLQK